MGHAKDNASLLSIRREDDGSQPQTATLRASRLHGQTVGLHPMTLVLHQHQNLPTYTPDPLAMSMSLNFLVRRD